MPRWLCILPFNQASHFSTRRLPIAQVPNDRIEAIGADPVSVTPKEARPVTSVHPARRVQSAFMVGATFTFLRPGMMQARRCNQVARRYVSALLGALIISHANAQFDAPAGGLLQAWCRPTTGFGCACSAPTIEDVMAPETLADLLMDLVA